MRVAPGQAMACHDVSLRLDGWNVPSALGSM
jgi:hypothetical protein